MLPGRHRPRDLDRPRPDRRRPRRADPRGDGGDGRPSTSTRSARGAGPGSTTSPAWPGRWRRPGVAPRGFRGAARVRPAAGRRPVVVGGDRGRRRPGRCRAADRPPVDPMDLVHVVKRSENGYIGLNNGIMDQFASIFGEPGRALLLDCRSLEHRVDPAAARRRRRSSPATRARRASSRRPPTTSGASQCEAAVAAIAAVRARGDARCATSRRRCSRRVRDRLDDVPAPPRRAHRRGERAGAGGDRRRFEAGDLDEVGRLFYAEPRLAARPVRGQQPRSSTRSSRSRRRRRASSAPG